MHQKLASGALVVPKKTMLYSVSIKLDVLYSLYQRQVLRETDGYRWVSMDSSPQSHWNLFAIREDRLLWHKASAECCSVMACTLVLHLVSLVNRCTASGWP